jgi:hypothetical protein
MSSTLANARRRFLKALCTTLLYIRDSGGPNNADKDSPSSVAIAHALIAQLKLTPRGPKGLSAQKAGRQFEIICAQFLRETFPALTHLRPGKWEVLTSGRIENFEQYSHVRKLAEVVKSDQDLLAVLGREYQIAPDILVARSVEPMALLNPPVGRPFIDATTGTRATLREGNGKDQILHASVSCKWTLRSDRAQNARSEALNLTRMRRGRVPHITVVTAEPLPSRLASLALGTDIDCVYHIALDALQLAVESTGKKKEISVLATMVQGKRLRDLTDLPLDLCV